MTDLYDLIGEDSPAVASIRASLATFKDDPAGSAFQRGYEAALRDLLHQVFEAEKEAEKNGRKARR